jgi:hypothetical protein
MHPTSPLLRPLATAVLAAAALATAAVSLAGCSTADPAPHSAPGSTDQADHASPSATATWYDDTWGTFAPQTVTGSGDKIISLPGKAGIATFTTTGKTYAVEELLTVDGKYVEAAELFNDQPDAMKQGGTSPWGLPLPSDDTKLEIKASGDWKIVLAPFASAPELTTAGAAGTGAAVFRYDGPAGTWQTTYDGPAEQGWFTLMQYSADNPDGNISDGSSRFAGPSIVVIQADGGWTSTKADWTIK